MQSQSLLPEASTYANSVTQKRFPQLREYVTAAVMVAELSHLAWELFHGGIRSHHFLNSADMPAISNAWGLLLLPLLTWFLLAFVQKRMALNPGANASSQKLAMSVIIGFLGSLLFGILLSTSFTNDYQTITEYLFMGMLLLALLFPVYRAECVLGFVLGMTFTFGAVLPTIVASVIAAVSGLVHRGIGPVFVKLWRRFERK